MGFLRERIPAQVRKSILAKYDFHCGYCGIKPKVLHVDHIIPLAHSRGTNEPSNLMPACPSCNNYKATFDLEQFRQQLGQQVRRAREHNINFRLAERFGLIEVKEQPIVFYFEKVEPAQAKGEEK